MSAIRWLLSRTVPTVSRSMSLCTAAKSCGVRQDHNSFRRSMFCLDLALEQTGSTLETSRPSRWQPRCWRKVWFGRCGSTVPLPAAHRRPDRPSVRPNCSVDRPMTVVAISRPKRQAFCNVSAFCWSRLAPVRATSCSGRRPQLVRRASSARLHVCPIAVGLFGSPLGGAAGCVFNALCRLFLLAWVCHLCFSADCRLMTCPSSFPSNAISVGPFRAMPSLFPSILDAFSRNDGDMARICRRLASHLPQFGCA